MRILQHVLQDGEEQQCHREYLEVVDHSDMSEKCFPSGVINNSVSLWTRDSTGGEDLVILVHAQRLPTQVLDRQGITVTHRLYIIHLQFCKSTESNWGFQANSRVNHLFELQNCCNQLGSKPAGEHAIVLLTNMW